jgi:hypothetical protein
MSQRADSVDRLARYPVTVGFTVVKVVVKPADAESEVDRLNASEPEKGRHFWLPASLEFPADS